MADFSSLKQTIRTYVKQNGNEEITGNILQDVLLAMVSTMGDGAINALASALQDETTARQNQDGTLQGNITAEATARQQADTALGGRIDGLQTAINGINTKLAEGYFYAGIATPSTNPGTPSGKVFYIAVSSGTYTNFSNLTAAQGINILKYNGSVWSKDVVYAIDARPKKNSQNPVTSGGVFDNMGALDVSELNATENPHTLAQYADLSAALAAIPIDYQKGGMSIKFVQSSDNKYVQYRLMATTWSTSESNWQGVDAEPTAGSRNFVESGGVYKKAQAVFDLTKSVYNTGGQSASVIQSLIGCVKSCRIYGGKNGYTYSIVALSRNRTAGTFVNDYVFYLVATDSQGNFAFFFDKLKLNDRIALEGLLQEVVLYPSQLPSNRITSGTLTTSDLPTKMVFKIDYNQIPDDGRVGDLRLVSTLRVPFSDLCIYSDSSIDKEPVKDSINPITSGAVYDELKELYPYLKLSDKLVLFNPSTEGATPTETGYVIAAGVSSTVFLGFRVKNTYNSDISKLAGNTVHFRSIFKFSGQDWDEVLLIEPYLGMYQAVGTISNITQQWIDNYNIVDWDWTFPSEIPSTYSGQLFIRIRTTNNTYPVTADMVDVLYQLKKGNTNTDIEMKNIMTYALQETIEEIEVKHTVINVSFDGTSTSGKTIHFSGLTAISDALNSINDNSKYNRYTIHVEGEFRFTDPLTVPMFDGTEYSIVLMKDYVDIEGDGPDRSIIMMDIAPNSTFHSGKTYVDYQPVYFRGVEATMKGIKVLGKNCRYAVHIEHGDYDNPQSYYDKVVNIEDCYIEYLGHPDYEGSYNGCLGTGISSGQIWNIKNSILKNAYSNHASFAMHTPLKVADRPCVVNFDNCHFDKQLTMHNYNFGNVVFVNIKNCYFDNAVPLIVYAYYNNIAFSNIGDYTGILMGANSLKAAFTASGLLSVDNGVVLRVTSLSTGTQSKVRFGAESTSFNIIVGNSKFKGVKKNVYYWDTTYGYVIRDGGVDLHGQAFGTIDADEGNTAAGANGGLGKLLGDCTSVNKTLRINVDGTDYTVTFNEDYTNQSNSYVLSKINAVIGSVATADMFCPAKLYYPEINGFKVVESCDEGAILKGMGVVHTENGIRKAKNSDGYIDGIALDDFANGQTGRIITKGFIYRKKAQSGNVNFYVYDDKLTNSTLGETFGIDPNNDGLFKAGATPALLRSVDPVIVKIL